MLEAMRQMKDFCLDTMKQMKAIVEDFRKQNEIALQRMSEMVNEVRQIQGTQQQNNSYAQVVRTVGPTPAPELVALQGIKQFEKY